MKVCVFGLWHLGSVTAACLASKGVETVGLDRDLGVVAQISSGAAPLFEPGLDQMLAAGIKSGRLVFTTDAAKAVSAADLVWVTFDTPVDDDDHADVSFVQGQIEGIFSFLRDGAIVLVSSQMPVGSVAQLERRFLPRADGRDVQFACSPENLRLGKAIDIFNNPGRIVIGARDSRVRAKLEPLLSNFCKEQIWISVESAEMTKHAINAWLATSVTFINEIASLCEGTGAKATEVEVAMRSEPRIGRNAYIRPGSAFAGGTLARDVAFLNDLADKNDLRLPLLGGILPSNRLHDQWSFNQIKRKVRSLQGQEISVLGLSYKPDTSAIRRSSAISLIRSLLKVGARVTAFDPQVKDLPADLDSVRLATSPAAAASGACCLVIATEWPEFRDLDLDAVTRNMSRSLIVDQNGFLAASASGVDGLEFVRLGASS